MQSKMTSLGSALAPILFCSSICTMALLRSFSTKQSHVEYWLKQDGRHQYLEEVNGSHAMEWVKQRNTHALNALGDPTNTLLYNKILEILDSKDKIPHVTKIGDYYYNFWQDSINQRGVFRRTTLLSYKSTDVKWEIVIDIDDLGKLESESWVYKGFTLYRPDDPSIPPTKILLYLSRGGSDATVIREFDLSTFRFVSEKDEGFVLPEAKSRVSWKTADILLVGTDFKDNNSMTDSGYPRVIKEWVRGTPLSSAKLIFEGDKSDVSVSSYILKHRQYQVEIRQRATTFYSYKTYALLPESNVGWVELKIPEDAEISQFYNQMLVKLRKAWKLGTKEFKAGSLIAVGWKDFVDNGPNASFAILFQQQDRVSLDDFEVTYNYIIIHSLENVKSRLTFWKYENNCWELKGSEPDANIRGLSFSAVDKNENDHYWMTSYSFLDPSTLYLAHANDGGPASVAKAKPLKKMPMFFNSDDLISNQCEAISEDGTRIPYFIVHKKNITLDGNTPTLLYGYGGFEIPMLPGYLTDIGIGWLEKGCAYAVANIRGGGEFGPEWHQAALKQNRKLAYDDFIAVAEDLIDKKITSPKRLALRGGSNGGLLMGNMMVRRPDLFGAICCAVPLLDMKRYHKLLAGASWIAEYGDPDTDDWSFLQRYSPYHNIDYKNAARTYPPLLMTTSTKDDRVHPYHARCFVKRLCELKEDSEDSPDNVFYFENIEGGHGGAADLKQQAFMKALTLKFLCDTIGK